MLNFIEKLLSNPDQRIKSIAKGTFLSGIIVGLACGGVLFVDGLIMEELGETVIGIITMLFIPILAWLLSVYLYGIGELFENSKQLKQISTIVPLMKHNQSQTINHTIEMREVLNKFNIKEKSTNELLTMWQTQRDQYSEQEFCIIADELKKRISNSTN